MHCLTMYLRISPWNHPNPHKYCPPNPTLSSMEHIVQNGKRHARDGLARHHFTVEDGAEGQARRPRAHDDPRGEPLRRCGTGRRSVGVQTSKVSVAAFMQT